MKPSSLKKVFGIISYFPNNDSAYHIETRRERTRRCSELLFKLEELWPDIDIIIIAQNWQDYHEPEIKNKIIKYEYAKLGILGARKELRKKFLESDYDYLIMLDDDGMISTEDPSRYMNIIDEHPDGMGAIKHGDCCLMLCAVSKYIYSRIDMPDCDPEKGQGNEDVTFISICFSKFPDKCFDFPKDCVKDLSYKYKGKGACPSSWARETKHDWNTMHALNDARRRYVNVTPNSYSIEDEIPVIDAVIPYVDCGDKQWIADFSKATGIYSTSGPRFRSWGTLKYLMRAIAKNMPFIRRIVLIVARGSQVPRWVNAENVKIVYHQDFIPKQFLPAFNSCTIESFLYRIEDLSERFIYFNDDMFPINKLGLIDFFEKDTPCIRFNLQHNYTKSIFRQQCRRAQDTIVTTLGLPAYPASDLVAPEHSLSAMLKSSLDIVGQKCEKALYNSITLLRNPKNINQYIYLYYQYFTKNYTDSKINYYYTEMNSAMHSLKYIILESEFQIVCINDSDKIKDYKKTRAELLDIFEEKFPDKCRYEL